MEDCKPGFYFNGFSCSPCSECLTLTKPPSACSNCVFTTTDITTVLMTTDNPTITESEHFLPVTLSIIAVIIVIIAVVLYKKWKCCIKVFKTTRVEQRERADTVSAVEETGQTGNTAIVIT